VLSNQIDGSIYDSDEHYEDEDTESSQEINKLLTKNNKKPTSNIKTII